MATGFVQVPPDSTGKKVDCVSLSAGGQTVVRQTVVIADPTKSAGYAIVSGGQQLVKGAFTLSNNVNISAMPNVVLAAGANNIGSINNISRTVTVTGVVTLGAGAANIGTVNNISAAVVLATGAAHIGEVNISVMPAVVIAAGANNIGTINNISATVNVAGTLTIGGQTGNASATVGSVYTLIGGMDGVLGRVALTDAAGHFVITGTVALAVGAANIGTVNNISAAVVLAAGAANIGSINNISANVNVVLQAGANNVGTVNNISAPVVLAAGAANIGSINNISAAVVLAAGAANIGFINAISATVIAAMSRVKLSASANIADNTVGMAWADKHGRLVTIANHPALLPSASHGPKTVVISTSASVALVAAPGANLSVYVTGLMATNGSATLTRADCYQASATAAPDVAQYLAASGGGFSVKFDPPWQISANTALNARIKPNASQALFTIHFYVAPA